VKKKILANLQRIIELFTQKIVSKLPKIWVWNPGSGKNLFRIPGSKRQAGSRIRNRNTDVDNKVKLTIILKPKNNNKIPK
jgi:hypothetical protein